MADEVRKRRFRWVRWVIWGLVVLAIGVTIAWHVFLSPARLRAMAESKLSEMVEGRISVAEAQFALERGIVVKGIRIEDPGAETAQPVAEIEAVTLLPRWGALLSGSFVLKEIQVEHPQINLELDEAGHWPFLSRLHPPKATGWPMPRVDVVRRRNSDQQHRAAETHPRHEVRRHRGQPSRLERECGRVVVGDQRAGQRPGKDSCPDS